MFWCRIGMHIWKPGYLANILTFQKPELSARYSGGNWTFFLTAEIIILGTLFFTQIIKIYFFNFFSEDDISCYLSVDQVQPQFKHFQIWSKKLLPFYKSYFLFWFLTWASFWDWIWIFKIARYRLFDVTSLQKKARCLCLSLRTAHTLQPSLGSTLTTRLTWYDNFCFIQWGSEIARIWILDGQQEVGSQIFWISNGIWILEAWPFEN